MRYVRILAFIVAVWCPGAFAQQVVVGAIPQQINATGVLQGVAMTGQGGGGTLLVGTVGGPQTNVFTNNTGGNPTLIAISTDASSLSNIVFNSSSTVFGAIGITPPGGPFFNNITGGNNGTTVTFVGPVFATITTVLGTGTMNFNSGSVNSTATNFAADGTISLAANTTVIGAMTTTAGASTGTLVLDSGSTLNGAVGGAIGIKSINVVGGSNIAGVVGTITGAANSFQFGLNTNTLNVNGALTIANSAPGGVINTTIASASVFGNIRPVGTTNLNASITANVTVAPGSVLALGTQFNLVQTRAGTPQSGTNGSILTINSLTPGYSFIQVPSAGGTVNGLVAIILVGIPAPYLVAGRLPLAPVRPRASRRRLRFSRRPDSSRTCGCPASRRSCAARSVSISRAIRPAPSLPAAGG